MKNIDTTFTWDSANHQTFNSPGVTILKGRPETFNKMRGCGLDVYGRAIDGTTAGPLILAPDISNDSGVINWGAESTSPAYSNPSFNFWRQADFRISGNRQLKTTQFIDGSDPQHENVIKFNLYDDSRVTLENLTCVILKMAMLETWKSLDFDDLLQPKFSISAEVVELFYQAKLNGNSILDVQANLISVTNFHGALIGGLYFYDNSGIVLNDSFSPHNESKLKLMNSSVFRDFSFGNINARTIYNGVPDNNTTDVVAIDAFDNANVSICTEQFLQDTGKGKIIQLSGGAQVTIKPMNGIIPINLVEEMYHPTEKCWPGMINFKSGSKATLRLIGTALQSDQSVAALNSLKLVYVDGKPVDIASNFNIYLTDGITLMLK